MAVVTEEHGPATLTAADAPTGAVAPVNPDLVAALALLSLAAGAIHFAFAPTHFAATWVHGLFFVVAGWFQLVWAVFAITRPSRRLYHLGLLNAAIVAVWVVSRTAGAVDKSEPLIWFENACPNRSDMPNKLDEFRYLGISETEVDALVPVSGVVRRIGEPRAHRPQCADRRGEARVERGEAPEDVGTLAGALVRRYRQAAP